MKLNFAKDGSRLEVTMPGANAISYTRLTLPNEPHPNPVESAVFDSSAAEASERRIGVGRGVRSDLSKHDEVLTLSVFFIGSQTVFHGLADGCD